MYTVKFHRIFFQKNHLYWKAKDILLDWSNTNTLGVQFQTRGHSKNLNFHFSPLFQLKFVVPLTSPLKLALLLLDTDSENLAATTEMKKINFSYFQ